MSLFASNVLNAECFQAKQNINSGSLKHCHDMSVYVMVFCSNLTTAQKLAISRKISLEKLICNFFPTVQVRIFQLLSVFLRFGDVKFSEHFRCIVTTSVIIFW